MNRFKDDRDLIGCTHTCVRKGASVSLPRISERGRCFGFDYAIVRQTHVKAAWVAVAADHRLYACTAWTARNVLGLDGLRRTQPDPLLPPLVDLGRWWIRVLGFVARDLDSPRINRMAYEAAAEACRRLEVAA